MRHFEKKKVYLCNVSVENLTRSTEQNPLRHGGYTRKGMGNEKDKS